MGSFFLCVEPKSQLRGLLRMILTKPRGLSYNLSINSIEN